MATSVITMGPIIILYPFLQKYFVKGMVVGAVKGLIARKHFNSVFTVKAVTHISIFKELK